MKQNVAHLGQTVAARRRELGLSQVEVWRAGGPSNSTLTGIENAAVDTVSPSTLRKLDLALQWDQGSARRVLSGGEATSGDSVRGFTEAEAAAYIRKFGLDRPVDNSPLIPPGGLSAWSVRSVLRQLEALEELLSGVRNKAAHGFATQAELSSAVLTAYAITRQVTAEITDHLIASSREGGAPGADDVETLNPDDEVTEEEIQMAARAVPGKPREQVEFEEHAAAGEESQDSGDDE